MRIRRRPPLHLSPPQNPNFSPQTHPSNERDESGLHPNGLNNDPSQSDPISKEVLKEEEEVEIASSSLSSHKTLDALVHSNERSGEEIERNANIGKEEALNGKKRRVPPVLMEGSRCSRVNGRGWRCSQQTLIGYSLCEHHLGKGRLRSVNASDQVVNKGTRKPKKEEKIRTMRARSLSCLLDEDDQCNGS